MKLNGIVGKGSGKLGASVFAISGGEQIVRQYNPQVSNPSTSAQVAQRAKLKLMSQLAAALAPSLGFKKNGLISARNQFVSKNIGLATYENGKASVLIQSLQLTPGTIAAPLFSVGRGVDTTDFEVALDDEANNVYEKIVIASAKRVDESNLQLIEVKVAEKNGGGSFGSEVLNGTDEEGVVFAYGVVAGSSKQKGNYGEAIVDAAQTGVELSVSIMNYIRNATLSMTSAEFVAAQA